MTTRVFEIDFPSEAIRQDAVIQDLEQDVEHVGMRLFDFVEQHHRIRPAAHFFGQLSAFFVADITRRSAKQPRTGELLLVLGHVDTDERVLAVEEEFARVRANSVFPTPVGPRKMNEPIGFLLPSGPRGSTDGTGHRRNRLVLPDHSLVKQFFHTQ